MGGCQVNIPCNQEIKTRIETQILLNNFNNKDIINKSYKNSFVEEPRVSNEEIKIRLPIRSFSTTKIMSIKRTKQLNDENINRNIIQIKRKSFNLTTAYKTPNLQNNENNSNDNFKLNSKKINKIEINNFGINNLNNNIISIKKFEKKNQNQNQIMLNSLISNNANVNEEFIKNNLNNIKDYNNKKKLKNIDNNIINNSNNETKKENKNFSFENLQIEDIISEDKIHTKNNHEVVFRGNLLLINSNDQLKNEMLYCVMSRINLKLYKNINFFLKMKKPLLIINLKSIKNIHIIKDESLGLCFSLLDKYIFTLNNKEQLFKWIVVLNYFSIKLREYSK